MNEKREARQAEERPHEHDRGGHDHFADMARGVGGLEQRGRFDLDRRGDRVGLGARGGISGSARSQLGAAALLAGGAAGAKALATSSGLGQAGGASADSIDGNTLSDSDSVTPPGAAPSAANRRWVRLSKNSASTLKSSGLSSATSAGIVPASPSRNVGTSAGLDGDCGLATAAPALAPGPGLRLGSRSPIETHRPSPTPNWVFADLPCTWGNDTIVPARLAATASSWLQR